MQMGCVSVRIIYKGWSQSPIHIYLYIPQQSSVCTLGKLCYSTVLPPSMQSSFHEQQAHRLLVPTKQKSRKNSTASVLENPQLVYIAITTKHQGAKPR